MIPAEPAISSLAPSVPSRAPGADRSAVAWPSRAKAWLLPGTLLLGLWLVLWNELRVDWANNDQYSYGWFVPPLAIFLLALRWSDRPPPAPRKDTNTGLGVLVLGGLLLLQVVRLVEEPNADWRLLAWVHGGVLVVITLAAVGWVGGRPWVRHFAFPVLFLLVAVRWPSGLEQAVVQSLMRGVALIASETMNLLGIPSSYQGNLIRVRGELVGVDEACSGIRSLQTMIMAGLFLGEMSRLNAARRLALLAGGLVVALVANVVRSAYLVWLAATQGVDQLQRYHDGAGLLVLAAVLGGLLWLNRVLERGQPGTPTGYSGSSAAPRVLPWPGVVFAAVICLTGEGGVALWYGLHERGLPVAPAWTVSLPTHAPGFRPVRIDDASRNLLRYDEARAGEWPVTTATQAPAMCNLFFFRWESGRASASLASLHQPHICLTATGLRETADRGTVSCPTSAGIDLPVRRYEFARSGRTLHVFWVVWQNRPDAAPVPVEPESRWDRLRPVWRGERNLGEQTLEVILSGPIDAEEAWRTFGQMVGKEALVRRGR